MTTLKPGSERPSGQEVVGEIMACSALPTPALIDALLTASADQRRGALLYDVQALRDARRDAPSLPQLREFALYQTADTGALFQARLAAWYGLPAADAEHCAIRQDPNVLPGTWGTHALDDPGPQRERACATGILEPPGAQLVVAAPCFQAVSGARTFLPDQDVDEFSPWLWCAVRHWQS